MKLDLLDNHQIIGIDFDGTLVNNPRSDVLQRYIVEHPDKEFHIVSFRTHNMRTALPLELKHSVLQTRTGLTIEHFRGVHTIPDILYERRGTPETDLEYFMWKAKRCQEIGATILVDDMFDLVACHCHDIGIVCLDPNFGYIPEPGDEMDTLIEWLIEKRGQYGECKGLVLDELYRRGVIRWYEGENDIIGYRTWPPISDFCWVELVIR